MVFVAVLGTVFVNLGEWQLDRLAQRQQRNVDTVANEQNPVVGYEQVFTRPIAERDQWQRVEARGTFDPDHQFLVRYRTNAGQNGYEVVTPLRTTSGQWVLVDRGFLRQEHVPLQDFLRTPSGSLFERAGRGGPVYDAWWRPEAEPGATG